MRKIAGITAPFRLLPVVAAVAGLTACSDIHPAPDVEEAGALEAPTHEQDALREVEREAEREGDRAN